MKSSDQDWNQDLELTITCNDNLENKEAIEFDYGLVNGQLKVQVKKALLMYFLMDWHVAPIDTKLPATFFPLKVTQIHEVDK
jgi:hypothetical protein